MNELAIIKQYTDKPLQKLLKAAPTFGKGTDLVRINKIVSALKQGDLNKASSYSVLGYEKNQNPIGILSRLYNRLRVSIDEAKLAIKRFRENKKLGSDAVIRSAVPISHTIRQIGESPIVGPLSEFNKKVADPLSKGRINNTYVLPTGAMSRISGAIALLKREINNSAFDLRNEDALKRIKKWLMLGKTYKALDECDYRIKDSIRVGEAELAKAWKRLYNVIDKSK